MAEPITIEVAFEGGDEAARVAERLTQLLQRLGRAEGEVATKGRQQTAAQRDATAAQTAAAASAIALTQKISAAANAVQSLTSQLGGGSRAAGVIGALTASAAAGAQLGATFGPQGAVVGGILGATLPAIQQLIGQTETAIEAMTRLETAATDAATAFARASAREQTRAARASGDFTALDDAALSAELEQTRGFLLRTGELGREARPSGAAGALGQRLSERLAQLEAEQQRRAETTRPTSTGRSGFLGGGLDRGLRSALIRTEDDSPTRRRTGPADPDAVRSAQDYLERLAEIKEREGELHAARLEQKEAELEAEREKAAEEREENERKLEAGRREAQEREEALERLREKEREYAEEEADRLRSLQDEKKAAYEQQVAEIQGVTDVVVGDTTKTLAALLAGAKSADEAFAGLLAGFLEYISQRAAIEASASFASAIQAFASNNYAGGAQHIAAALAWGGVAVAAGGASVAINQAAAQQGPAPIDRSAAATEGGRGGDVNVYYNGPVVTAGTRQDLAEELTTLIREAA